jgi:5-methylcytosine-specific restriction endonuclease McrA
VIECSHPSMELVWVPVGTPGVSTLQLRWQCRDCFEFVGGAQRHTLAASDTPKLDQNTLTLRDKLREERWAQLRQAYDDRLERWTARQEQENAEWWQRYNEYLTTDKWQEKRRAVFERDGGICQGCRSAKATQVHHHSYRNVCNEFLWELTPVCDECHARYHSHDF